MGNERLVIRVHEGFGMIEFDIDGGGFDLDRTGLWNLIFEFVIDGTHWSGCVLINVHL